MISTFSLGSLGKIERYKVIRFRWAIVFYVQLLVWIVYNVLWNSGLSRNLDAICLVISMISVIQISRYTSLVRGYREGIYDSDNSDWLMNDGADTDVHVYVHSHECGCGYDERKERERKEREDEDESIGDDGRSSVRHTQSYETTSAGKSDIGVGDHTRGDKWGIWRP